MPELVEAMDKGEIAISSAAAIAKLPPDEQHQTVAAPKPKKSRRRGDKPKKACRRDEHRDPFAALKATHASERKRLADLERGERLIDELEALYATAEPLIRQQLRNRLCRMVNTFGEGLDTLLVTKIRDDLQIN